MAAIERPVGLVKSLFSGRIRPDLFVPFPQPGPAEASAVDELLSGFSSLAEKINTREIDAQEHIPEEVLEGMRALGLFGITVPRQYGGLGLGTSAYGRVIEAVTAVCPALMLLLGAHLSIGLKGLLLYGTEEQKGRYLPSLAAGKAIAAFALTEPQTGSDANALRSIATRDGQGWRLNGRKIWISNGDVASMITVFARTPEAGGDKSVTAFLLEPSFSGFTLGPNAQKLGLRGSNSVVLQFKDVYIPPENVLGQPGEGFKIAVHILNSGRIGLGAACAGGMKNSLQLATEWALQREAFGSKIAEYELIQAKIAQMAVDIFAVESMVRLSGGMVDRGVEDYAAEAAMCKVVGSEAMWNAADELVQIAGGRGYVGPFPYERILRDSRVNRIFEGTNEILRLLIFEEGTKPMRRSLAQAAKSPLGALGLVRRKLSSLGKPELPAFDARLSGMAGLFRDAVAQLNRDTEALMMRHGKALIRRQLLMARVADMASDVFAMAAVLSRVDSLLRDEAALSQALPMAQAFFRQAADRFETNRQALSRNDDEQRVQLARLVYDRGSYPLG